MGIRKLKVMDSQEICELYQSSRNQSTQWSEKMFADELKIGHGLGKIFQKKIVSFLLFRTIIDVWEITLLATHAHFLRQGHMLDLLTELNHRNVARERITLEVHAENQAAIGLYEKLGFELLARRERYYHDRSDALIYSMVNT